MTLRKKCFLLSLSLVLLIFIGGCGEEGSLGEVLTFPSTRQEEPVLFDEFLDAAFANLASQDTLSLHFTLRDPAASGIARKDAAFADLSAGGIEKSRRDMESLLTQLESFSPGRLTDRQRVVYDTLKEYLTLQLDLLEYTCYEELLSPSSGLHVDLPILLSEYVFSDKQDVEDYLALLDKVDIYFSNIFSYEKEKSDLGLAMNDGAMDQVISFCNTFGTESEEHLLLASFRRKIMEADFLTDLEKEKYIDTNENTVRDKVLPSYRALAEKMETLKGTCVNEEGLAHVSGGKDYYTLLVRQATGTKDAPLMLSYRIRQQRETDMGIMTSLFAADPTLASRCAGYQYEQSDPELMLASLQQAITKDFPACSGAFASISVVDDYLAPYTAPAFYLVAPIDDYQDNVIYYNPSKVSGNLDLFTTIAHEGFPGHLYQTVMSYSYGLENVRSMLSFPGFTEGWATYVEMISYHYAGMDESLATVLEKNYSVILSLYATADIGIHYRGWDVAQTLSFFSEYGISDREVVEEIYQMILSDPANYLKYYVGYLSFLSLRQEMAAKYPDTFTLYEFHKCILETGPTSFDLLEEELDDYFLRLAAEAAA